MIFLFAVVALDVAQVLGLVFFLLNYLGGIDPSGWTILSSASVTFFGVLRLINGRKDMGLSLFPIFGSFIAVLLLGILFILLKQRTVALWAPGINFSNIKEGLQVDFCFCITYFLYHFFSHV